MIDDPQELVSEMVERIARHASIAKPHAMMVIEKMLTSTGAECGGTRPCWLRGPAPNFAGLLWARAEKIKGAHLAERSAAE